ncbi:hypothetical protein [Methylocapsa aurea]|uniref:hypothetical protein n=1 Tax=Methylocapsa aurea TaxID=663610 RepID=UPI00055D257E|nr:hypothetical protein [Methylocapsa aurea]
MIRLGGGAEFVGIISNLSLRGHRAAPGDRRIASGRRDAGMGLVEADGLKRLPIEWGHSVDQTSLHR